VARALNQAGFQVHYTTVARWKSQGWIEQEADPLDAARANLDAATPVLTTDPTTRAADLADHSQDKPALEKESDAELLRAAARAALITMTLVERELHAHAPELVQTRPAEVGILIQALADLYEAATEALVRADALDLPKR